MVDPYYQDEWTTLYYGNSLDILHQIGPVSAIVTSPPYAEQRKDQYGGIPEDMYPDFTIEWMDSASKVLESDGSALINIRPHLSGGVLSDYVLRTRVALLDDGWVECEELIWFKPNGAGPFGSIKRPRRAWEHILWFGRSGDIWCDPKANGSPSKGYKSNGLPRKGEGDGYIAKRPDVIEEGSDTMCLDVVSVTVGGVKDGTNDHPAVYPNDLARWMIKLITKPGGVVLDPFAGSGTTLRAARDLGFKSVGIEISEHYCEIVASRFAQGVLV